MLLLNAPYNGASPPGTEFFTGTSAASPLVPDTYHVSIDGRPYMVDLNQPFYRQYRRQLAQLIRTQADTSKNPGEQSLDPNSLWRRSFEDWSLGAGQTYLDRTDSVPNRFRASKGVDCLTSKWQITLLPDTVNEWPTGNTNLATVVVGTHIYAIDGQQLIWFPSVGGSRTVVTGTPAVTASSICTDGFNVWVAYGASGVYTTTEGAATATQSVTSAIGSAAVLGYCNGRLMLADTNKLYNIVAVGPAVLPAALLTAGNPNMAFVGFAEGNGAIYVGAHAGNRSWIYGMTVTTDGTALGAPVVQGALPAGETISAVFGYLGFLIVGSSQGVRMCTTAAGGAVSLGALIPTPAAVQCVAGVNRWVYFGWSTFDSVSTGLGRLDLVNQVISGALPAYASDLMATSQAAVTSIAVYGQSPLFTVSGLGLFAASTTQLVASGTITSGYVLYDLIDPKVACLLDTQTAGPLTAGSYSAALSTDAGAFTQIGLHQVGNPEPVTFGAGPVTGQRFEVQITLNRDATTLTAGPTFTRWTLRSYAAPLRPLTWQLPLILDEEINNRSGADSGFDPLTELAALEVMATSAKMVSFQEGRVSYPVFVQDVEFLPSYTQEGRKSAYFNGIALVTLVGLPVQV